jgi:hypothetical protein
LIVFKVKVKAKVNVNAYQSQADCIDGLKSNNPEKEAKNNYKIR